LNPKAKETPMLQDALRQRMLAGLALGFVAAAALPASARAEQVRFATFNASLNRSFAGELIFDLSAPDNEQAQAVAEIIQRVNPDVLLLNEFDFDLGGAAISLFQENYLSVSQNGAQPVEYPFVFFRPSNTGIASGFDLDNDGEIVRDPNAPGYGEDALGFGAFAGQFAMVLLSKFPIKEEAARTFQLFLWKDMPGALLPSDPATGESWYSPEELEVFRLSSKNHWDVPIQIGSRVVHVLASHPTPPVFDGPEDRNGKRNHDEIRLWADYVVPRRSGYIVDDQGSPGGLGWNDSFVVMGDQNADPNDGDSVAHAIRQLLDLKRVNTKVTPMSEGGIEAAELQNAANDSHETPAATDTADFADEPPASGNLRVDYVLPSRDLKIINAGVFWPTTDDPLFPLVVESSDHRLVWVDLMIER
jgi:Endonuclease/Exonuclease/phosphatase family